jgi:hypothetical protein
MTLVTISMLVGTLMLTPLALSIPPMPTSPSCMLNGKGCPLPHWKPDWSLVNSTALMNANLSGFTPEHKWGFVTLDWQSGADQWLKGDPADCDCEAASASTCRELKAAGSVQRCSIYHNMELALEWLESERAVMDDAHVRAGWFLRYRNGSVYSHPRQVRPGMGPVLRQWFIDWRNPHAAAYFVDAITQATAVPGVDATFADDSIGVPDEHPEIGPALGLTAAELAAIQLATQRGEQALAKSLAAVNRTCWNCIDGVEGPMGGSWGMNTRPPPANPTACAAAMIELCRPERQHRGLFMSYNTGWNQSATTPLRHEQTVAAFLVTRPPLAFLGTSYGLGDATYDPLFTLDVGEPIGVCVEHPPGVFSRQWSHGVAALDCNTDTASLPFRHLPAAMWRTLD